MDPVPIPGNQAAQVQMGALSNETNPRPMVVDYPYRVFRKLAGLKPWKASYFSLYDSLNTGIDQLVAWAGVFFAIAAGIPLPLIGLIFGRIINNFPLPEDALRTRIIELLGVGIAYFLVTAIYVAAFGLTSEKISVKLRQRLLNCLLHLDQAYLDTHDLDINSLITEKIDTIKAGTSEKVGIFIQSISYFVAAFTVGFILNARITGILLASAIPAISLTFLVLSPLVSKCSRASAAKNGEANGIVESALRAVRTVQAYDMSDAICQRHLAIIDESTRTSVRKAIFSAVQTGLIFFIAYAANGLAFFLGSRETESSGANAGTVYAVVFLIIDASFVVGQFAPFLEIFSRAATARGSLQELFEAGDAAAHVWESNVQKESRPSFRGCDIHFKGVSFSYPARPTVKALDALDLTFQAGKFTALVGTSGGGKSTLVSLLLRTYSFDGAITIGSYDICSTDFTHFRSQVAILEQECILFSGTIFDNICHGLVGLQLSESEKIARCEEAVKAAGVDFLQNLPRGIHTRISNEIQLSGGQKQRVCLARALVKNPAVLVLDEPTSALDARSEVLVMEAVRKAAASGTTVIMVAHRLSTVLDADHVVVMGEGKVLEQGPPAVIAGRPSVFAKLLRAQNTNFDARQNIDPVVQKPSSKDEEAAVEEEGNTRSNSLDTDVEQQAVPSTRHLGLWALMRRMASMVRSDFCILCLGILASAIAGGVLLGESIVFGNLVQLLNTINSSYGQSQADFYCLMFFILGCIALVAYVSSGSAFGVSSARLTAALQVQTLKQLLHLDMQWFAQQGHSVHDLMGAFTKDPGDLSCLSGIALGTIFTVITSVFGGIVLAHVVAWKIAVVLLAAVPVMLVAGYLRLRVLTLSEVKHREAYQGATSLAVEACRSRKTVSALGIESHLLQEYHVALQKPFRRSRNFTIVSSMLLAFCLAIPYFVYALAYWWGSKQVRNGTYSTRQFFTVLPALLFSAQAAGQLFSLSPEIARAKTAARSVFSLLDARPKIMTSCDSKLGKAQKLQTLCSPPASPTEKSLVTPKLQFGSVSLAYPSNATKMALNGVDIAIAHGETVAFVGPSGGGKSSAISLIERFFDPTSGAIFLDGVDVRTLDVRHVRRSMGLVSQEPDLFTGSISYNVKLGAAPDEPVTQADVEMACKRCGLHDFISSLPDGYNTDCGTAGTSKLSGGQKQRLAIARALVRDPQILLLDEPTSALDAHSEAHVQATLAEAAKGRTTVMVAHRLASIQHANKIYVFDQGRIVAAGSHAELVQSCSLYAGMAKAQSLS